MSQHKFIATSIYKYLNEQQDNHLIEGSYADSIRKDMIEQYLKNILDEDTKEELSDDPDYDLLLEPTHYLGYEYQTYIQYIDDNTFKYYEGFSKQCWNAFKSKAKYKGKSKAQIITDFIENRAKKLGLEFGYNLVKSTYFIHDSFDFKDYILILTYKK